MLLVFILIGVLCSKVKILDENASGALNKLVLYICGPMMVLNSVQSVRIDAGAGLMGGNFGFSSVLLLCLYGAIFNIVTLLIGFAASRLLCGKSRSAALFRW